MRVLTHQADRTACGRYRIEWPSDVLRAAGYDVVDRYDHRYQAVKTPTPFGDRVTDVQEHIDGDVVVFQRPLRRDVVELMDVVRKRRSSHRRCYLSLDARLSDKGP